MVSKAQEIRVQYAMCNVTRPIASTAERVDDGYVLCFGVTSWIAYVCEVPFPRRAIRLERGRGPVAVALEDGGLVGSCKCGRADAR